MKIIIIAGGLGTRIAEETEDKPKPMVLINDKPIIWHLMNIFCVQGFNEFIISTGYKSEVIDDWVGNNKIQDSNGNLMDIQTVNTGLNTQTGGRISEVMKTLPGEKERSAGLRVGALDILGTKIEFVPMRTESYDQNSRVPKIEATDDPREDAKRRDLTINAIYYNIDTESIEDYSGGVDDLSEKVERISTKKRFSLRNLMMTATPEGVCQIKEEIVYVDTDVLHCKTNK